MLPLVVIQWMAFVPHQSRITRSILCFMIIGEPRLQVIMHLWLVAITPELKQLDHDWVQSYAEYQPCPEPINKWNAIIFSFVLVYYEYKSTKLSKNLKLVNHVKTIQLQIFLHNYRYKNKHKQDKNHIKCEFTGLTWMFLICCLFRFSAN